MEVIGYPKYLIYDDGRVWSEKTNKFMIPQTHPKGYMMCSLYNKKSNTVKIHRLVALHYIPNPMNYPEVDHKDRNQSNNHYTNLRWCTNDMNAQNKGMYKNNKTGHKGITIRDSGSYRFDTKYKKIKYNSSTCKNLNEVLWFKFVFYLNKKNGYYD